MLYLIITRLKLSTLYLIINRYMKFPKLYLIINRFKKSPTLYLMITKYIKSPVALLNNYPVYKVPMLYLNITRYMQPLVLDMYSVYSHLFWYEFNAIVSLIQLLYFTTFSQARWTGYGCFHIHKIGA